MFVVVVVVAVVVVVVGFCRCLTRGQRGGRGRGTAGIKVVVPIVK